MLRPTIRIDWYASWPAPIRSWPWPLAKFSKWPFKVKLYSFHAPRHEKHDAGKMNVVPVLSQKLLKKTCFHKHFFFWRPNRWSYTWNASKRALKELSNAFFPRRCNSSSFRVMCQFVEKCWNRQNLTFGYLWWPDLWPDQKKWPQQSLHDFLRSFECRLLRVATWPRSRVRGGGGQTPSPGPARLAPNSCPARAHAVSPS